jgi:hypothetical protein
LLARFGLSLLLFLAWMSVFAYQFNGDAPFLPTLGIFALALATVAFVVLTARALLFRLAAPLRRLAMSYKERSSPAVPPQLKRALFREACLLAILLERLGSEAALEKEMPPEIVITTRRVLLDRLADAGLRDELDPWLLDLMLAPDGHWSMEQKQRAFPAWECLSVLRWVLGLAELRGLTDDPRYNLADARSLFAIKAPENLVVLPGWDLRGARNSAGTFFHRSWSELLARRQVAGAGEDDTERALRLRADILESGFTGDYLVGAKTITELPLPLLRAITVRAHHRWQFLALLVEVVGEYAPPESIRKFLARYFAPAAGQGTVEVNDPA